MSHAAPGAPVTLPGGPPSRLRHFPVAFFSVAMGLAGFAIAVLRAEQVLGLPTGGGAAFLALAALAFGAIAVAYVAKLLKHPGEVRRELEHPIKLSFFPTYSISLVLLSIAVRDAAPVASLWLLALGAPLQLALTLFVLTRWIERTTFEVQHSNPSWFIPVVGNILVPVAAMDHGLVEISWFFFSVGLVFWIVLQTIIFNRVIFHHPLPDKLAPTFFILMAPPAVGFIAWVKMTGEVDAFARILFNTGLFTAMLVAAMFRRFLRIRFFLSWWAYSFPLAALAIAATLMARMAGTAFHRGLAWLLLAALAAVIATLVARTAKAIAHGEICEPE
jgi:tellurite resistance protein